MDRRGIYRTSVTFASLDRDLTEGLKHSLADTCLFLQKYLDDEFELVGVVKLPERSFSMKNLLALDDTQALMMSIKIMGERIIRKYCKKLAPHYARYAIWKKGLQIADMLELENLIQRIDNRFYRCKNLIFLCRVYDIEGLGLIIIPESKPCSLPEGICCFDMPPLLMHSGGLKKHATRLISEFNLDKNICTTYDDMERTEV